MDHYKSLLNTYASFPKDCDYCIVDLDPQGNEWKDDFFFESFIRWWFWLNQFQGGPYWGTCWSLNGTAFEILIIFEILTAIFVGNT